MKLKNYLISVFILSLILMFGACRPETNDNAVKNQETIKFEAPVEKQEAVLSMELLDDCWRTIDVEEFVWVFSDDGSLFLYDMEEDKGAFGDYEIAGDDILFFTEDDTVTLENVSVVEDTMTFTMNGVSYEIHRMTEAERENLKEKLKQE